MKRIETLKKTVFCCALVTVALGVAAHSVQAETIVPNTSEWKWLHPSDGKDPAETNTDFHTSFFNLDFDDASWKTGKDKPGKHGGFGYGDKDFEGVDLKQPEEKKNRHSAYLRLKFTTEKEFSDLVLQCQRDDGIIVYLDGKEVVRSNIQKGKDVYKLHAKETIYGEGETKLNHFPIPGTLAAGEHVLAISLHNRGGGSSDLRIAEISIVQKQDVKPEEKHEKKSQDKSEKKKEADSNKAKQK